jgi:hypothetical protein
MWDLESWLMLVNSLAGIVIIGQNFYALAKSPEFKASDKDPELHVVAGLLVASNIVFAVPRILSPLYTKAFQQFMASRPSLVVGAAATRLATNTAGLVCNSVAALKYLV